jgi:hypothetical protein
MTPIGWPPCALSCGWAAVSSDFVFQTSRLAPVRSLSVVAAVSRPAATLMRGSDVLRPREMCWPDPVAASSVPGSARRGRVGADRRRAFRGCGSEGAKRLVALAVAEALPHCMKLDGAGGAGPWRRSGSQGGADRGAGTPASRPLRASHARVSTRSLAGRKEQRVAAFACRRRCASRMWRPGATVEG